MYLNPPDWDVARDGGELVIYPNTETLEKPPAESVV
eukprot:CAMPEP_0197939388 /NCGR_PEP_ID=MMETSP1439-20131203/119612_1 /TAXON_ID=66791 /ORGANISM="Gonyaulax spinifera, Strain CCMP409" /LENGTH=35 /DNA_ID= /DNA_START= /DNA_END= /DNA_ORIENTATION=